MFVQNAKFIFQIEKCIWPKDIIMYLLELQNVFQSKQTLFPGAGKKKVEQSLSSTKRLNRVRADSQSRQLSGKKAAA